MREPIKPTRDAITLPEIGECFVEHCGIMKQTEYIYMARPAIDEEETAEAAAEDVAAFVDAEFAKKSSRMLCQMAADMVVEDNGQKIWPITSWDIFMLKYPNDRERLTAALRKGAGFDVDEAKKD